MIDCLVFYPDNHPQENSQRAEEVLASSIYWTDDLAITGSSANTLSRYHTALAFGATVACSAGALMQYTETGFWYQPDNTVPDNTVVRLEKSEPAESAVVTPPVAVPETTASFSSQPDDASECNDSACKGIAFIDERLPELQAEVQTLRSEMEQFQTEHTAQNLQTHQSILAYRSSDVARRYAELDQRSQQLDQQVASLTAALAIHPDEAEHIANLLSTDISYQTTLGQLLGLQGAIAFEYSNPELDNLQLEQLYDQYAEVAEQLRTKAQDVLSYYVSSVSFESPDPLWQEDTYYGLLQELIDLAHFRQMHVVEQGTLASMEEHLTQRRTELTVLLRQYSVLQRRLEGQTKMLQEYISKRQELQTVALDI